MTSRASNGPDTGRRCWGDRSSPSTSPTSRPWIPTRWPRASARHWASSFRRHMPLLPGPPLARYLRREVFAYSAYYRPLLTRSGAGVSRPWGAVALQGITPQTVDEFTDPGALVLRPDPE